MDRIIDESPMSPLRIGEQVALAETHLSRIEARVHVQRKLIARLQRAGDSVGEAETVLTVLEASRRYRVSELERLHALLRSSEQSSRVLMNRSRGPATGQ